MQPAEQFVVALKSPAVAEERAFALIRQWGDPVLRERARAVEEFDDAFVQQVSELESIMRGADGAGLAATQVGSLRRVFVYRLPDDEDNAPARVVVNPQTRRGQRRDRRRRWRGACRSGGRGCTSRSSGRSRS